MSSLLFLFWSTSSLFSSLHRLSLNFTPSSFYEATKRVRYKCGLSKACPNGHFSFKVASGAATVVGPRMCLEDKL